ncbi:LSM domain-containing protein [Heterostelium album PN500]|uniref:snRNP core protein D2 n=1 Tax=Heterostelium pallidum (strain ATCC 26659 / Pp 5 / PN500) TaxID=670386 RepID=D3B493_HETP5|nr:LSM domain-containing protein [Heterostelium album PN500]EFA84141.1 LSM domain-containing protein [Heterostelium album PN500]|eukprot:XP_020436258.1 LSM domain-containing protein [Heterostelium album PN500]
MSEVEQEERDEQKEFETGPLSILMDSVNKNTQVLINVRNNKKLLGTVRAFDRHCNMVLENVKEMWTEIPKTGKGKKKAKPVNKDRFISKILILSNLKDISYQFGATYRWKHLISTPRIMVGNGYFDMLKEYLANNESLDEQERWTCVDFAIQIGRFDIFEYLFDLFNLRTFLSDGNDDFFYDDDIFDMFLITAVKNNRMAIVKYLFDNINYRWHYYRAFINSPLSSSLEMVVYFSKLVDENYNATSFKNIFEPCSEVFDSAASVGSIEIIEWLIENRPRDREDNKMFHCAAKGNHANVVRYLMDEQPDFKSDRPRCGITCIDGAAENNNFELMKLFHLYDFPEPRSSLHSAVRNDNLKMVKWLISNYPDIPQDFDAIDIAATNANLEMIQWLTENTTATAHYALDEAARKGNIEILEYLTIHRTEDYTTDAMDAAARFGHLEAVKWLNHNRTEGCSEYAMDEATIGGHFDLVVWLSENRGEGCTHRALDNSAMFGHYKLVKWLSENRTEGCSHNAIESDHLEIVSYLLRNRPEFGGDYVIKKKTILKLIQEDLHETIDWILNKQSFAYYKLIKYQSIIEEDYPSSLKTLAILNLRIKQKKNEKRAKEKPTSKRAVKDKDVAETTAQHCSCSCICRCSCQCENHRNQRVYIEKQQDDNELLIHKKQKL